MRLLQRWSRRRRLITLAAAAVTVVLGVAGLLVAMLAASAPLAVPVIVASTILGDAASVFGDGGGSLSGDQLARAADGAGVYCDATPAQELSPRSDTQAASAAAGVSPIPVGTGGSVTADDTRMLLEPLDSGVSALRAHVWFLYRLAGLGDWSQFSTAYTAAGLSDREESADAPLRQVQELNTTGADIAPYRLTAAALVAAGEQTDRFTDPYPDYRQKVTVELVSGCLSDSGLGEQRMTLPPPRMTPVS